MVPDFSFANQKIVILGLARQGLALARFFFDAGATVTISDRASEAELTQEIAQLAGLPIEFVLGGHPLSLLDQCDVLCLSGGVPPQIEIVQEAIRRKIPLTNDVLLTMQLAQARGLGPLVAITGSSGKTTTTTLVGEMLQQMGHPAHVGGNIGLPLIDKLSEMHAGEFIVLELSSFQLELFDTTLAWKPLNGASGADDLGIRLDVAALLNITSNHLDRHADMADYTSAKLNLARQLGAHATLVVNADDPVTAQLLATDSTIEVTQPNKAAAPPAAWAIADLLAETRDQLAAKSVIAFSQTHARPNDAALHDGMLTLHGTNICAPAHLRLRGAHNISNALAAAAISHSANNKLHVTSKSARSQEQSEEQSIAAIAQVMKTFDGVPHRLEVVADSNNIQWINDSIATSPERTLAGLRSFDAGEQCLILLIGGQDKNLSWEMLAREVNRRVNHLIGFGEVGSAFVALVQEQARFARSAAPSTAIVNSLGQAVKLAGQLSHTAGTQPRQPNHDETSTQPTVVLLSPGGTSYDAYKDFEERGEHFRQLVGEQIGEQVEA